MPFPMRVMYGMMCAATQPQTPAAEPKDVFDTAASAPGFETLAAAIRVAGLVETLKGEGPFTVFAPLNAAFQKLPAGVSDDLFAPENRERLRRVLTYHVVPGRYMAADLAKLKSLKTVSGDELALGVEIRNQHGTEVRGVLTVDGAALTKADVPSTNGVIHAIGRVLMPKV